MRDDLPTVRLLPRANARAIRHGFPWVYANELVLDRRTKKLEPGTLALLEDAERRAMGVVAVNPASKIAARMLDTNVGAQIDRGWFEARVARALALRERLFDAPFYRLIHAEADGLPGVVVDRFDDTLVVQPNAAWLEAHFDMLVEAVLGAFPNPSLIKNGTGRARTLLDESETDGPFDRCGTPGMDDRRRPAGGRSGTAAGCRCAGLH